jgi:AcrR family transcriptional regulator
MSPEQRRAQLLDVTLRVARERGFQGLSIDAVAREAQITRPVVYDSFGDLPGLLHALADREEARAVAALATAIPELTDDLDPERALLDGLRAFLDAVRAQPDTWRLVLLPPSGTPAALRERIETNRRSVLEQLRELVAWGVERRGAPQADPELIARMIIVLAEDAARLVLTSPRRYSTDRFVEFTRAALAAMPARAA